jgi:hypothetical protein
MITFLSVMLGESTMLMTPFYETTQEKKKRRNSVEGTSQYSPRALKKRGEGLTVLVW